MQMPMRNRGQIEGAINRECRWCPLNSGEGRLWRAGSSFNLITNKGNEMENKVLDEIVKYAAKQLNNAYGFCGVASSPNSAFLNSSDREGNDIFIKIEVKPE